MNMVRTLFDVARDLVDFQADDHALGAFAFRRWVLGEVLVAERLREGLAGVGLDGDPAAELGVPVRVGGVGDRDAHARVPAQVADLPAVLGRAEDEIAVVEADPDYGGLGAAVGVEGGDGGEVLPVDQRADGVRKGEGHITRNRRWRGPIPASDGRVPERPNVALVASDAPNATLGAWDAPNATLGRWRPAKSAGWDLVRRQQQSCREGCDALASTRQTQAVRGRPRHAHRAAHRLRQHLLRLFAPLPHPGR